MCVLDTMSMSKISYICEQRKCLFATTTKKEQRKCQNKVSNFYYILSISHMYTR